MTGKILAAVLCFSLLLNVFLFIKSKPVHQPDAALSVKEANSETLRETTENNMLEQFRNEGSSIPAALHLSDGTTLDVKTLLSGTGTVLVYRFDNNTCSTCIENELANIARLNDTVSKNIVILTSSFNTVNQARMYIERFNIHCKVYNITKDNFQFTTEAAVIPCYFMVDKDLKATRFFVPDKNNPSLTDSYFKIAVERNVLHYQ